MSGASSLPRRLLLPGLPVCLPLALAVGLGIHFYGRSCQEAASPAAATQEELAPVTPLAAVIQEESAAVTPPAVKPETELSAGSFPTYLIEPLDVLQIEMLNATPQPHYRTGIHDVLRIQVVGTVPDHPIGPTDPCGDPTSDGEYYLVEAEGTVNLGPAYGSVRVAGMTIEQIEGAIHRHLRQTLTDPVVSVELAGNSGNERIIGPYSVEPDGTIELNRYGAVHVGGKTVEEARAALEEHLSQFFDAPEVDVAVAAYNSKVYYVTTEGADLGEKTLRVPISGNQTVLDVVSEIDGLPPSSDKDIWIARPPADGSGPDQILPVDWDVITRGGATPTNYQIVPGDRIHVASHLDLWERLQAEARRLVK